MVVNVIEVLLKRFLNIMRGIKKVVTNNSHFLLVFFDDFHKIQINFTEQENDLIDFLFDNKIFSESLPRNESGIIDNQIDYLTKKQSRLRIIIEDI